MAFRDTGPQFKLRIPSELKEALVAAAAENKRSLTAEILSRLEASFQPEERHISWGKRIAELERNVEERLSRLEISTRRDE